MEGCDGSQHTATVECYDPEANQWSDVQPLSQGRDGHGVANVDGLVYAVGGDIR